jgi:hypothetical protein
MKKHPSHYDANFTHELQSIFDLTKIPLAGNFV